MRQSSTSGRILVDTGAFAALAVRDDTHHQRAMLAVQHLATRRSRLITTNFVVAETHALVLARAGRDLARRVLSHIEQAVEEIVRVGEADEQRARTIIDLYDDKDFTLTDATSFAVMERLGIVDAFTFDRHFLQFGFLVLGLNE